MAAIAAILEIGFALFVLNRKANLLETWYKIFVWLVNRNRKFVLMEIPRWPSQSPSWKCILNFFWTERPTRSKLVWCITMICRSKSAKIILIGNQNWSSWQPCLKFILIFFLSEPKDQLTRNFTGRIEVTCRSKAAKITLIGNPRWLFRFVYSIYEGVSINNQPISFPMDREGHDFHALFQYMFYTWV